MRHLGLAVVTGAFSYKGIRHAVLQSAQPLPSDKACKT